MTSFNHYALGSVAELDARAYRWLGNHRTWLKKFRVAPIVGGGLTEPPPRISPVRPCGSHLANGTDGSTVDVTVTVPVGTTAVVDIPDHEVQNLTAGTHHLQFHI
mgnify:CR=1 FL=1